VSVVHVEDVWKGFRIPHEKRTTVVDYIAGALSILEGKRYSYEEFWALKKVNLELEHGESLGIIGPNGSGKTTLLKLIARIMKPDKGAISTSGSVATVLELGIGFHGDLTVKENAQVYGVIMGLPRSEMKKRMDPILDFAGLTRFQDARLKSLSSGMVVRLAFSIAIQTEADIFLVDEALAVGDMEFQEKCLERFREFKKEEKSIVLVSHSMDLVRSFCEKTLYLLKGEARAFGPSEEATRQYLDDMKNSTGTGVY
jgi:lipopolysaccharide transport system ATP-binding protein